MKKHSIILKSSYRDSVFLMKLSQEAQKESGADQISAMMATPRNKDLFNNSGLLTPEIESANPDDLAIAIKSSAPNADEIIKKAETIATQLLTTSKKKKENFGKKIPKTLSEAYSDNPNLNIALISVPGEFAPYEALQALKHNMDVMLYSDNISMQKELALKSLAKIKNKIVMGPDCGTSIINGIPLGFANEVKKGNIGLVGASGTGLQEVSSLLSENGLGISNIWGTGGRDLKDEIGGISTIEALNRLSDDPNTKIIGIISKPPGSETRNKINNVLSTISKPVFIHYLGVEDYTPEISNGVKCADSLTELAISILNECNIKTPESLSQLPPMPEVIPTGVIRGVFSGGTLCQEALEQCKKANIKDLYSNLKTPFSSFNHGSNSSKGNCFWDLGDDYFTQGKPHPMIEPTNKIAQIIKEISDPEVGIVIIDLVTGYGSHPKQAEMIAEGIKNSVDKSIRDSKLLVASVCGTKEDQPNTLDCKSILEEAGFKVLDSNFIAINWAIKAYTKGA